MSVDVTYGTARVGYDAVVSARVRNHGGDVGSTVENYDLADLVQCVAAVLRATQTTLEAFARGLGVLLEEGPHSDQAGPYCADCGAHLDSHSPGGSRYGSCTFAAEPTPVKQADCVRGTVVSLGHPANGRMAVKGEGESWRLVDDGSLVGIEEFRGGWDVLSTPREVPA